MPAWQNFLSFSLFTCVPPIFLFLSLPNSPLLPMLLSSSDGFGIAQKEIRAHNSTYKMNCLLLLLQDSCRNPPPFPPLFVPSAISLIASFGRNQLKLVKWVCSFWMFLEKYSAIKRQPNDFASSLTSLFFQFQFLQLRWVNWWAELFISLFFVKKSDNNCEE